MHMDNIIYLHKKKDKNKSIVKIQNLRVQYLSNKISYLEDKLEAFVKKKISFKTMQGIYFFNLDEILYFKAEGSYSSVHALNRKELVISQTLKNINKRLIDSTFIRIHQSYFININHLHKYEKKNNTIILDNGEILPVSRSKKEYLNSNLCSMNSNYYI